MPPSPEQMARPASREARARAILASREIAPKDMWEIRMGISSRKGWALRPPSSTARETGSSSSKGRWASWAGRNWSALKLGTGRVVRMASTALEP